MMESVVCLPSYAATGIARHGNHYYVSVGAAGGSIQVLDMDLNYVDSFERGDVRDVVSYKNGVIALAGTTDTPEEHGSVIIGTAGDFDNATVHTIEGFGSDYHRATIEVYEGTTALLGLSKAGWMAMDLRSAPETVYSFPNPKCDDSHGGCPTNGVSTDGNLVFTANGGYGFRVFRPQTKGNFDALEVAGRYDVHNDPTFEWRKGGHSANHVEMKGRHLFVASGSLGTFVYTITNRDTGS